MRGRAVLWPLLGALLASCSRGGDDPVVDPHPEETSTTAPAPCVAPDLTRVPAQIVVVHLLCDPDGVGVYDGPGSLRAVRRATPPGVTPLLASVTALFDGVTEEEAAAGFGSGYGDVTRGLVLDARVEQGIGRVDLAAEWATLPNFSTADVSALVQAQLTATVDAVPEVVHGYEVTVGGAPWCGYENPCEAGALGPWRSAVDPRLPVQSDLGGDFVEQRAGDEGLAGPCTVGLPGPDPVRERSRAEYSSNEALQRVRFEVLVFDDGAAAARGLAAARDGSSCDVEGNLDVDGASPASVSVPGTDEAFALGYADAADVNGVVVARRGRFVLRTDTTLHQGAVTADGPGSHDLAERFARRVTRAGAR